jgi:hypothetical protein
MALRKTNAAARVENGSDKAAGVLRPADARFTRVESGDSLLIAAESVEREQQALLEAAPIEQTYQEALALHVQSKHSQVERIEDRLENLIDQQQARLQQTQASTPGLLSFPSARHAWQRQLTQQQARLQTLHTRLEAVREIKEGMGLHVPKIEELATRKMRAENPDLAADWDSMREATRRHQMLVRQKEQQRALSQERPGRSLSLGLSQPST